MGRSYGRVAGDLNPIHLWPITAKLFGFKRAIVHGMWSLARVLGELDDLATAERCHVEVRFRTPIMLPAKVLFGAGAGERGTDFSIHSADGQRLHLSGTIGAPAP
jgi:acyl dehydratase